jgi:hypothetical protein
MLDSRVTKGPPESPWQASLPSPLAQIMLSVMSSLTLHAPHSVLSIVVTFTSISWSGWNPPACNVPHPDTVERTLS